MPPPKKANFLIITIIVIIHIWAIQGTGISISKFYSGLPNVFSFLSHMYPPDFTNIKNLFGAALETIQMAILGTTLATIWAIPLSLLASKNVMRFRVIYEIAKLILDIFRGVSEVVWGLLFVSMVGLGPFSGVLALAIHNAGALGKYFSEAIENIRPSIIDVVKSTGSRTVVVFFRGIIPELRVLFLNYFFYYFEHSVRAATVLGLVGAGGIGLQLLTRVKLFQYNEVLAILIIIMTMVIATDRLSSFVRNKILSS